MEIFSQNNEQNFILYYFKEFKGTFLDIGANDGVTFSNTLALVKKGWVGTLVEASPNAYDRLLKTHNNNNELVLLNYAVGSYDGTITLHESGELVGKGDTSLVSSTKEDEVKRWGSLNIPFKDIVVPVKTFESMLNDTKYKKYDLVSIDIEGMEKEVVPQIDFKELGTKMAIIEWNGVDADFYDNYMFNFGFILRHVNAENRIYGL